MRIAPIIIYGAFLMTSAIFPCLTDAAPESGEFIFAENGHSCCTIVVNHGSYPSAEAASRASDKVNWFDSDLTDDTICTESFAAVELHRYLCAIAGLDPNDRTAFPIASDRADVTGNIIIVGSEISNSRTGAFKRELDFQRGPVPVPGPEGFRIKTVKADGGYTLLIAGFDRVGTLYGVYDFLNLLGVRWFEPGLIGEVIPHMPVLTIPPLDRTDAPKFTVRGFWAEFFVSEHTHVVPQGTKGTIDFFDWAARNRMNLWSAGEQGVPAGEMKKRGIRLNAGGHTFHTLLDPHAPYPYRHTGFSGGTDKPSDPYPVSDDYMGDSNKDGILSYSEAHPEWYGLGPDGKRHFPVDPFGYNFCTSNENLMREFLKNLVEKLNRGEWKYADTVDWWPADANNWCRCPECARLGSPTDRNILMAHRIREEMKRARADGRLGRDIRVNFLFYTASGVIDPPTRPLPEGFDYDSALATFFPIVRCYVHAFDDPSCMEYNRPYFNHLKAWRENPYYKGMFMIGEYYNISGYRDLPILFTRTMAHDIRYYYESGARAMHYMHVPMANWGPRALTNALYARLLWNPAVDESEVMQDYFLKRYDKEAAAAREFYESLERAMINVPVYKYRLNRDLHDFAAGRIKDIFTQRHLHLEEYHPTTDDGPDMEETIRELDRAEGFMKKLLARPTESRIRACILEDEGLFRFGAATIRLYYRLARTTLFPLKSPDWTREMREAVLQAEYLDAHPVGFASHHGGTMGMMRNALDASGVRDVYEKWRAMMR